MSASGRAVGRSSDFAGMLSAFAHCSLPRAIIALIVFSLGVQNTLGQGSQQSSPAVAPLSASDCKEMEQHQVLKANPPIGCDRLVLVTFPFVDFAGASHTDGRIVVLDAVGDEVFKLFHDLYLRKFPIERAKLMNEFNGDDDASMLTNNTSGFNHRNVAGSHTVSMHAYGVAIDINPVQNPVIEKVNGAPVITPPNGASFTNRTARNPGMAEQVIHIFSRHGFTVWGGAWIGLKDYQHFQVEGRVLQLLLNSPKEKAKALFSRLIKH